jgi:hypothetical protein
MPSWLSWDYKPIMCTHTTDQKMLLGFSVVLEMYVEAVIMTFGAATITKSFFSPTLYFVLNGKVERSSFAEVGIFSKCA